MPVKCKSPVASYGPIVSGGGAQRLSFAGHASPFTFWTSRGEGCGGDKLGCWSPGLKSANVARSSPSTSGTLSQSFVELSTAFGVETLKEKIISLELATPESEVNGDDDGEEDEDPSTPTSPVSPTPSEEPAGSKRRRRKRVGNDHKHWDKHIPTTLFVLRRRTNEAIDTSPSVVFLGQPLCRPGNWQWESEPTEMLQPEDIRLKYPQSKTEVREFNLGKAILIRSHPISKASTQFSAGLADKWDGPYLIVGKPDNVYWPEDIRGQICKATRRQIRPYPGDMPTLGDVDAEGDTSGQ
ncbi:hypothetical protein PR048_007110 [Dryococelus australis]|uniref:Uncharacterized protein n=1 Tax=Dryococelus australis TaxID=614101 RepID=A0ABQ9IDQ5_9NEOP|nr:hypothetical protein PR048_007110 [Dryococelus australis]